MSPGRPSPSLSPRFGCRPRRAHGRRRGSVLVIVLVTVLFASAAVVAFIDKAGDDLIVQARDVISRRLRQDAYSALEVTLAVLEDFRLTNNGLRSPAEGWTDLLGFAGWTPREGCTVEVSFTDESGKLSLPHVDSATFLNLFESWELSKANAERLTDALLSWMSKDHVSTETRFSDYEQGPLPYVAPLRPLRSYSELAAIDYARTVFYDDDGRPNDLWRRFVGAISLLDFKQTNLNAAQGDVVAAFGSMDRSQQQQLGDYLSGTGGRAHQGPAFFESTTEAANILGVRALPAGYGTEISALRITIVVREGSTAFRLSAVVAPTGGATLVKAVTPAAQGTPTADNSSRTASGSDSSSPAKASDPAGDKKLKYPFTLLEIVENAEISSVPVRPTKA